MAVSVGNAPLLGQAPPGADAAQRVKQWLYVWIAVGLLVVLVVVGFLFGIANALEQIDGGLQEASSAVGGVRGDVEPLPTYIQRINASLGRVDTALKPLSGQADTIVGNLGTINGTLGSVENSLSGTSGLLVDSGGKLRTISGSLVSTSGSLVSTSGSLVSTSGLLGDSEGRLRTISGSLVDVNRTLGTTNGTLRRASGDLISVFVLAGRINHRLVLAEIPQSEGTNAIWRHVRFLNGGRFLDARTRPPSARSSDPDQRRAVRLEPPTILNGGRFTGLPNPKGLDVVKGDTGNIVPALGDVNTHLDSICRSPALSALSLATSPATDCTGR